MNSNLQEDIQQFLRTWDIHGPELAEKDWAGNADFHLLKQARKLLIEALQDQGAPEHNREWLLNRIAEQQASMCNNAEKEGIVLDHFKSAFYSYSDADLKVAYEAHKKVFGGSI